MILKTRKKLANYFHPYVKELELISGKKFNWKEMERSGNNRST